MSQSFRHTLATTAIIALISTHAAAEPAEQPPVLVTATRLDGSQNQYPGRVSVITAEQIHLSPARNLPDLLALEAGVLTRRLYGNNAARATIDTRGFGAAAGANTLILLDGRRLNDVDLAAIDFAAIPLGNIERIEIIHGGGAVLYGDGAVGSSINIVTRAPGTGEPAGQVQAGIGGYGLRQLEAGHRGRTGALAWQLNANRTESDGYRDNNRLEQGTLNADLRLSRGDGEWFLRLGQDNQNLRLPGVRRVNPGSGIDELHNDPRGTNTPRDFANQDGAQVTAGYTRFLAGGGEAIVDIGHRRKQQTAFFDDYTYGGAYASYVDTELSTLSFTPRIKLPHRLFNRPGTMRFGLDVYRSDYDSLRALNPTTIAAPVHRIDVTQDSLALYWLGESELTARDRLMAGARVQRVKLRMRDIYDSGAPGASYGSQAPDLDTVDNETMAELGWRHRLDNANALYARLTRSVRFATVDEVFETDPTTYLRVFSPLRPQVSRGLDAGFEHRQGPYEFSAGAYVMRLRNEIHFDPNTFTNENLDPTERRGLTMAFAHAPEESVWRWRLDYTLTESEFRSGTYAGKDVPLVPLHSMAATVQRRLPGAMVLSASARYTGRKRFDNDQTNTFAFIPGYTTVDVKIARRAPIWTIEAGISNLFSEKAFDYGVRSLSSPGTYNAYPLPERSYWLSVARKF